jgi:methylglutaconyl-CoA hydratase
VFSAGLDLEEALRAQEDEAFAKENTEALADMFETIYHAGKPIVAAVNGHAVAGGAGLMSVCDIAIAARSAQIGYPEIVRGLIAAVIMPYLLNHIGERRAKWLLLTGRVITAEEAERIGLLTTVTDDDKVLSLSTDIARQLAALPQGAYAETKRFIADAIALPDNADAETRFEYLTRFRRAPDAADAIRTFLNRE